MITYELAKKLKEAGFPEKLKIRDSFYWHGELMISDDGITGPDSEECICCAVVPNLSELIAACAENFNALRRNPQYIYDETDGHPIICGGWSAYDCRGIGYDGSTPEEAVANLWLALQKK